MTCACKKIVAKLVEIVCCMQRTMLLRKNLIFSFMENWCSSSKNSKAAQNEITSLMRKYLLTKGQNKIAGCCFKSSLSQSYLEISSVTKSKPLPCWPRVSSIYFCFWTLVTELTSYEIELICLFGKFFVINITVCNNRFSFFWLHLCGIRSNLPRGNSWDSFILSDIHHGIVKCIIETSKILENALLRHDAAAGLC